MKKATLWSLNISLVIFVGGISISYLSSSPVIKEPILNPPVLVDQKIIQDESEQAFHKMMKVLTHQRCINCHPQDGKHLKLGGATNLGVEKKLCSTCHQNTNNLYSGVPGAPDWAMAPQSMAWQGLSKYEIARSMMDRAKNGDRSPEDIMHHLTEHELVLWAWEPGIRPDGTPREKPPVPKEEYIKAVKKWIELGAVIPEEK